MKIRSRARRATPDSGTAVKAGSPTSPSASPSPLTRPPTPTRPQKRKLAETDLDDSENVSNSPRPSPGLLHTREEPPANPVEKVNNEASAQQQDAHDLTTNANNGAPRSRPASNEGTPGSPSPRRSAKGGGRARGGGHANGGGPKRGKQKGRGGRGGDSPEPPNRRRPLTQDERVEISMLKARQHELKRFFAVVGAQQSEILDQLATRDLSKLARKPKAHTHVPEHDAVKESLESTMADIQEMIRARHRIQVEQETLRMEREKEVIEEQFKVSLACILRDWT